MSIFTFIGTRSLQANYSALRYTKHSPNLTWLQFLYEISSDLLPSFRNLSLSLVKCFLNYIFFIYVFAYFRVYGRIFFSASTIISFHANLIIRFLTLSLVFWFPYSSFFPRSLSPLFPICLYVSISLCRRTYGSWDQSVRIAHINKFIHITDTNWGSELLGIAAGK